MLKRRIRNVAITGITIVSATMLTALAAAGASAATTAAANVSPAVAGGVRWAPAGTAPATHIAIRMTVHTHADSPNAAGDPCATWNATAGVYTGITKIEVARIELSTYYCWNGVAVGPDPRAIVTYHHTKPTVLVTQPGEALGWNYIQNISGLHFWCYVARGSVVNCSGNAEYDQVEFQECVLKIGCGVASAYPWVQEEENYRGQAFAQLGNAVLP